jgi:hypothetical protein
MVLNTKISIGMELTYKDIMYATDYSDLYNHIYNMSISDFLVPFVNVDIATNRFKNYKEASIDYIMNHISTNIKSYKKYLKENNIDKYDLACKIWQDFENEMIMKEIIL